MSIRLPSFLKTIRRCAGCKYLYSEGMGFANDARSATKVSCALDQQLSLPDVIAPTDSVQSLANELAACSDYSKGNLVSLDVMGYEGAALFSSDADQIDAITRHSGRPEQGEPRSWALAHHVQLR